MTVVNNLIRRARERPSELTINDNQVGTIVEHFLASQSPYVKALSRLELETMVRAGKMQFMAIPVRVVGHKN